MNETEKISPDDPRLTAYALGELEPAERAAFERLLERDAAARAALDEIRATVAALDAALEREAADVGSPALDADHAVMPKPAEAPATRRRPAATLLTFPRFYYMAAGLAAACFAVIYVANERSVEQRQMELANAKPAVRHEVREDAVAVASAAPLAAAPAAEAPRQRTGATSFAFVAAETQVPDRFFPAAESTVSTFPLRLGKAAFAAVREELSRGQRPPKVKVHVAGLINAFEYAWPEAAPGEAFATLLEETAAPWAEEHRLVRVGVKGVGTGEIARAARVQVEFNPKRVRAWRLIGFERNGDEIGVSGANYGETMRGGDTVTALYEIVPARGSGGETEPMLQVALHYVDAGTGALRTMARQLHPSGVGFGRASNDMKFVAAVAAFGLAMRESPNQPASSLEDLTAWAEAGAGSNPQRREFVDLMRRAGGWLQ